MHPCNLWESLCCCGGKDTSATIFRTQRICVNLCNLWEALLSSRFCEFRGFCGNIDVLPQISQICTDVRVRRFSHGFHRIHRTFCLGIFSHRLHGTHRTTCWGSLPQIARIYTDAANFRGVHLSPLGFAACQSKKCTNRAKTDCLLVKFNNGLNGFVGCVDGCVDLTTD